MLWSLAASTGIALVWLTLRRSGGFLFKTLTVLLVILGLAYPIIGIASTTNELKPSNGLNLDGTSYLQRYNPDEAQAIEWL